MPTDDESLFGDYDSGAQTLGPSAVPEAPVIGEVDSAKCDVGKPHPIEDAFGGYVSESQTVGASSVPKKPLVPDKDVRAMYGSGKPRRIIVRGSVAADNSSDGERS